MHPGESLFTGVKVIDYRNGRFQGLFNSQTEKRQGMGILVDDDMNIYCSEWEEGRMSGPTFVYMNNGSYIYGLWRNNEPHGINLYRNKQFILIGAYHRGNNAGNTLAITDAINHMMVFSGEEICSKDKKREVELISSEDILEISFFEDIIYHTAAKNEIRLNKSEVTLVNFLQFFSEKHTQHLQFINKHGLYYFGFKVGLGFRFTLHGKVNHRISMISIGTHEDERLTDFGIKFHDSRCVEEGHFTLKETITYNRNSERPRDKCHAIFQKNHKKSLNFINEYYQFKSHLLLSIEHFLSSRLSSKYQNDLKLQFERRRLEKQRGKEGLQEQKQKIKVEKEDVRKQTPSRFDKNGSSPNIELREASRQMGRNRSYSNFNKKSSKPSFSPIRNIKNRHIHDHGNEESLEYQQYKEIQDELTSYFKKQIICERCKSKQKRKSQNKHQNTSNKKSLEKKSINSKSTQKLQKNKSQKEIKYLVNYRPPQRQSIVTQQSEAKSKSQTKSSANLHLLKPQEKPNDNKEKIRIQNEMKIRREIHEKQLERDARNLHQLNYPLTFTQFLGINGAPRFESGNVHTFSPSSRELRILNEFNRSSHYDFEYQRSIENQLRYGDPYADRLPPTSEFTAGVESIKKIEEINNRRDKILRQFKALNTSVVPHEKSSERKPIQPHLPQHEPALRQPLQPHYPLPARERLDQKLKISEFNKRYRNYLAPGEFGENEVRPHGELVNNEPYVASFTFSPMRETSAFPKPATDPSREYNDRPRKRYEYFFN